MEPDEYTLCAESPESAQGRALIAAAVAELEARYPEDEPFSTDLAGPGVRFVIARLGEAPVGCAALLPLTPETGEIKRMYVRPEARGRGIGRLLVRWLIAEASALGYTSLVLETGTRQPEAIALYQAEGFTPIPCSGIYAEHPLSRCYEKKLK